MSWQSTPVSISLTEQQAMFHVKKVISENPATFRCVKCASHPEISEEEALLGTSLHQGLRDFLAGFSNGMRFGDIQILPVRSKNNVKKTANSIAFINSSTRSIWFGGDQETFDKFIIFATDGSRGCFSFNREMGDLSRIWYWVQGDEKVIELDYGFWAWLAETIGQEKCIRN
ncbi:SMI1/KNR4 family protein [Serratia nevei]|uniref:SMI1/KNR4 family protein n=1 Tax=Serratia nevei TaxID=2703794 RepID=UPI00209D873F|nr:SMI1/KNR4 family protein [Serratia nevei]MCP1107731.1 SMI1/KNR4 family protein [Serratia nevei]